ncbi:hypothetical protein [Pseudomonas syringae]|uniref:Autotransporter domain-containing protein n=1 Tax=Pseudomonas syringae TaxID=317 RepID=A0A9Q4A311_PSESX|nr:hypothetical protein [Pseudomonas syringae]MCF5466738.1 hypothetical protein [Pseudomonas syringae]MCF5471330.1 hypothetical protein [Pseudomonas syringae]MCF5482375.1 hypothetical protein [Pseudomonas syringae]MCF5486257.1 hypothetical protein [Pseudomonas syringae]MCF5493273.1 hypothetical protein [Pseudomonas syringae]
MLAPEAVTFDRVQQVMTERQSTTDSFGEGMVAKIGSDTSLYREVSYSRDLHSNDQTGTSASLGVRLAW